LYFIWRVFFSDVPDRTYSIGFVTSNIETDVAIITACGPALWPLARRWFPSFDERLGIDRPMCPDIEVGYARAGTPGTPPTMKATVKWHRSPSPDASIVTASPLPTPIPTAAYPAESRTGYGRYSPDAAAYRSHPRGAKGKRDTIDSLLYDDDEDAHSYYDDKLGPPSPDANKHHQTKPGFF
jgi:hypothetical protein